MLYVKAKVTQNNGDDLADDAAVGPVNLFLHSLFSQVDISLNGTLITASTYAPVIWQQHACHKLSLIR